MKTKKSLVGLILMLIVALTVSGCGTTSNQTQDNKANSTNQMSSTTQTDEKRNGLLADVTWLKTNLDKVIILDARTPADYKAGHIPGAINTPWQGFAALTGKPGDKDWGVLLPKEQLAQKIGALGINEDKNVVVYADPTGWGDDGRIIWMMRMAGLNKSRMLDGGWPAWKAAQGQTTIDVPTPKAVELKINALDENLTATTDWVKANLDKVKVVDARSKKEFDGAIDYGEKRGGHLPNAINIPFNSVFKDDGTVMNTQQLKDLFTKAGLKPDDEIVTYCTKGIRSAHLALILRMAGFEKTRNYDPSFYSWAGDPSLSVTK